MKKERRGEACRSLSFLRERQSENHSTDSPANKPALSHGPFSHLRGLLLLGARLHLASPFLALHNIAR